MFLALSNIFMAYLTYEFSENGSVEPCKASLGRMW